MNMYIWAEHIFEQLSIDLNSFLWKCKLSRPSNTNHIIACSIQPNLDKSYRIMIYGPFRILPFSNWIYVNCVQMSVAYMGMAMFTYWIAQKKNVVHLKAAHKMYTQYNLAAAIVNTINCNCGCNVKTCNVKMCITWIVAMEWNERILL